MLIIFNASWLLNTNVAAHEVRPAYLALVQLTDITYQMTWKRPMRGDKVIKLTPQFPADCQQSANVHRVSEAALTLNSTLTCEQTLSGRTININGLSATMTDVLVRVDLLSGDKQSILLRGGIDTLEIAQIPTATEVLTTYVGMGIEHILLGADHLLFVFCLLLLVQGARRLILTITAFTIAHSITLGLATLGMINVPQAPVEAVIALSIVLLSVELVQRSLVNKGREKHTGWMLRWPWLMSFAVGLLHGLGFAGALSEIGLPAAEIPLALLSFNLGVELGQLAFVLIVLLGFAILRRFLSKSPIWQPRFVAEAIGVVAAFWVVERTWVFL